MDIGVLFNILDERENISTLFEYLPEVDKYYINVIHPRLEIDIGVVYWNRDFRCYCFYPIEGMALLPEEIRDTLLLLDTMNENVGKLLTLEENK